MDDARREEMSREMYGDAFGGLERRVATALAEAGAGDDPALRAIAGELRHLAGVLDMVRGRLVELERRAAAD